MNEQCFYSYSPGLGGPGTVVDGVGGVGGGGVGININGYDGPTGGDETHGQGFGAGGGCGGAADKNDRGYPGVIILDFVR